MPPPSLQSQYPWTSAPLVISAPIRPFATSPLATAVSLSGGFGFLSYIPDDDNARTGTSYDLAASHEPLRSLPRPSAHPAVLPLGIGYLIHSASLALATKQIREHVPAAIWLFAPTSSPATHPEGTLGAWAAMARRESAGATRIWVQVGSVGDALAAVADCGADVTIVVQGTDAGGHGLVRGAGLIALLPEVADALADAGFAHVPVMAAGGIADARAATAAMVLGAAGVVLGTRFLASEEVGVPEGFREGLVRASDGGQSTFRTSVFDRLRGTKLGGGDGWPENYGGRGLRNVSSEEIEGGRQWDEVKKDFDDAQRQGLKERFGSDGRDVIYVGTAVGLVKTVMPAREIIEEIRGGIKRIAAQSREWN